MRLFCFAEVATLEITSPRKSTPRRHAPDEGYSPRLQLAPSSLADDLGTGSGGGGGSGGDGSRGGKGSRDVPLELESSQESLAEGGASGALLFDSGEEGGGKDTPPHE